MAQPRHINLNEQAKVGSLSTAIMADFSVTTIKLADDSVTTDKIQDGAITSDLLDPALAGNGLSFNTGALNINVDDVTIGISSDTLFVKSVRLENFTSDPAAGSPGRLIYRTDLSEVRVDDGFTFNSLAGGGGSGHTIQDEGLSLPQRAILDFVGTGVTVTDGGTKTVVTIPGSSGHTIEDEGLALPQRSVINFVGLGVTASDLGGKTVVTVPGSTYAQETFTVSNPLDHVLTLTNTPISNSQLVSWNGLLLREGLSNDYTLSANVITLSAGITLSVGDELLVAYAF